MNTEVFLAASMVKVLGVLRVGSVMASSTGLLIMSKAKTILGSRGSVCLPSLTVVVSCPVMIKMRVGWKRQWQ